MTAGADCMGRQPLSRIGARRVVNSLDLVIPSGSVCGFVGPNGAGKTTTIPMLLGLIRPTSGEGLILTSQSECIVLRHGGDNPRSSSLLRRPIPFVDS